MTTGQGSTSRSLKSLGMPDADAASADDQQRDEPGNADQHAAEQQALNHADHTPPAFDG